MAAAAITDQRGVFRDDVSVTTAEVEINAEANEICERFEQPMSVQAKRAERNVNGKVHGVREIVEGDEAGCK